MINESTTQDNLRAEIDSILREINQKLIDYSDLIEKHKLIGLG